VFVLEPRNKRFHHERIANVFECGRELIGDSLAHAGAFLLSKESLHFTSKSVQRQVSLTKIVPIISRGEAREHGGSSVQGYWKKQNELFKVAAGRPSLSTREI
jgi:hypothetical protein